MSLVLPKEVAESKIPETTNSQVELTKRPAGKFAVIRIAGQMDADVREKQQSLLEGWIEKQGYAATGESEVPVYDWPWTPGRLRRNEILIRIGSSKNEKDEAPKRTRRSGSRAWR